MQDTRSLLFGTDGAELSLKTSSEEEIITPTNATVKSFSTQGSDSVQASKLDNTVVFNQKGGTRVLQCIWGSDYEYQTNDLTTFYPEAGDSVFTALATQRQPDTRIHCVRTDGTVRILVHEPAENITSWCAFSTTSGDVVEDVVVIPGDSGDKEDSVYYFIKRVINSVTVRHLEKWALESECQGGTTNKQCDSHLILTCAGGTITGLTHLEGESVNVWGNGKDLGSYTVTSGQITGVTESGTLFCVGVTYTGDWQSAKLALDADRIGEVKNIGRLGLVLHNTHFQGLKYGRDFSNLDNLPKTSDYKSIAADTLHTSYDEQSVTLDGTWSTDERLCLRSASPRPCTVLAAIPSKKTNIKG